MARGRYRELYDKQHGLESNLFLAPGEGDTSESDVEGSAEKEKTGEEGAAADALRLVGGEYDE
jgi:hypothetical protein